MPFESEPVFARGGDAGEIHAQGSAKAAYASDDSATSFSSGPVPMASLAASR